MNVNITQAHIDGGKPLETAILEQMDKTRFSGDNPTVDIDETGRVDINGLLMYQLPAAAVVLKAAVDRSESVSPISFEMPE